MVKTLKHLFSHIHAFMVGLPAGLIPQGNDGEFQFTCSKTLVKNFASQKFSEAWPGIRLQSTGAPTIVC